MNTDRNKYLTEAMGECAHEWNRKRDTFGERLYCYKCDRGLTLRPYPPKYALGNDFSTWQGFGKLWEWANRQEWFGKLLSQMNGYRDREWIFSYHLQPDIFANAVYEFLKGRES